MSKYTTQVRYICESYLDLDESVEYANVNDVIARSIGKVFDFDFPIFDESYRSVLETKILKHYYTREIGLETVGLWKLKLDTKLNEIMPYYNQLYKSELLEFNPMYDVNVTREHTVNGNGTRKDIGNGTGTGTNINKYSDTPQGALTGLLNDEYMSSASVDNSTSGYNTNNDSVMTNTEQYLETVRGKQGTGDYSSMLLKYRETFLNIDMMIIEDLSDLFMGIW